MALASTSQTPRQCLCFPSPLNSTGTVPLCPDWPGTCPPPKFSTRPANTPPAGHTKTTYGDLGTIFGTPLPPRPIPPPSPPLLPGAWVLLPGGFPALLRCAAECPPFFNRVGSRAAWLPFSRLTLPSRCSSSLIQPLCLLTLAAAPPEAPILLPHLAHPNPSQQTPSDHLPLPITRSRLRPVLPFFILSLSILSSPA